MTSTIIFDPLIPLPMLWGVAALALAAVALAVLRGLQGWALRGAAMLVVLAALSGPSVQQEDRAPLTDIVVMLATTALLFGLLIWKQEISRWSGSVFLLLYAGYMAWLSQTF